MKQIDNDELKIHKSIGLWKKEDNCRKYAIGQHKVACTNKRYYVKECVSKRWDKVTCKRCLKYNPNKDNNKNSRE